MNHTVLISDEAIADLAGIFVYLLPLAGEATARKHIQRLEDACRSLEHFPQRGSIRDDLIPGLRLMGYNRQATIAFIVNHGSVTIIRIFGKGLDVEGILREYE
jgi:toxin ParE1/3/4